MLNARPKQRAPQRDIALQVVPLIDIMFLLLLFFMLGADMSQRECPELALPRADVPLEPEAPAPELLVRADAHAPYGSVQELFQSAARAGVYKVELAAARR